MLKIIKDDAVQNFLEAAGPLLYQNEAVNSLMLGVCGMMQPEHLFRVVQNDQTLSAAIQSTAPHKNLILTFAAEGELHLLAQDLHKLGIRPNGVVGPARESEIFSDIWSELIGKRKQLAMGQKIYEAKKVVHPKNIRGQLRLADLSDLDLVTQWQVDFAEESLPPNERKSFEEMKPLVSQKIGNRWAYLWMVDNKIVSMACVSRPTKNGISVNTVFTPKNFRKRGYASAATAAVTQAMLDSGKEFCVLYTDLANPTSNKIYQDIGYKEVADSKYFQW